VAFEVVITRDEAVWLTYCARHGMSVLVELIMILRER